MKKVMSVLLVIVSIAMSVIVIAAMTGCEEKKETPPPKASKTVTVDIQTPGASVDVRTEKPSPNDPSSARPAPDEKEEGK
jgi:hypothetical protein